MTPEQLVDVILGGVGVLVQLLIAYFPGFSDWYQNLPNKGLVALAFDVAFGGVLFAIACVPVLAALFNVGLVCDVPSFFLLLRAVFIIATTQQLTYLVTKSTINK